MNSLANTHYQAPYYWKCPTSQSGKYCLWIYGSRSRLPIRQWVNTIKVGQIRINHLQLRCRAKNWRSRVLKIQGYGSVLGRMLWDWMRCSSNPTVCGTADSDVSYLVSLYQLQRRDVFDLSPHHRHDNPPHLVSLWVHHPYRLEHPLRRLDAAQTWWPLLWQRAASDAAASSFLSRVVTRLRMQN